MAEAENYRPIKGAEIIEFPSRVEGGPVMVAEKFGTGQQLVIFVDDGMQDKHVKNGRMNQVFPRQIEAALNKLDDFTLVFIHPKEVTMSQDPRLNLLRSALCTELALALAFFHEQKLFDEGCRAVAESLLPENLKLGGRRFIAMYADSLEANGKIILPDISMNFGLEFSSYFGGRIEFPGYKWIKELFEEYGIAETKLYLYSMTADGAKLNEIEKSPEELTNALLKLAGMVASKSD